MNTLINILVLTLQTFYSFLPTKEITYFSLIEGITYPQQIVWRNSKELFLVKDSDIYIYDIATRKRTKIGERLPNEFVGLSEEKDIAYCQIEHFLITSPEEFSTEFKIYDSERELIRKLSFFETIRPIQMNGDRIIAVTALDFLEQHTYEIHITSGEYEEVKRESKKLKLMLPTNFPIKEAYALNEKKYVVEDIFGNLYLYTTAEIAYTIIPTLTPIFKTILTKIPMNDPIPAFKLWLKSL